jgi:very-short-patch-repair endonuclease
LLEYAGFENFCRAIDSEYNEEIYCKYSNLFYGRANCSSRKKANRKKTFLERYGVETPGQILEGIEKKKTTCLKKYGFENPMQCNSIKEKSKHTWNNKSDSEKQNRTKKSRDTCLKKYGVKNPLQNKYIKEKQNKTVQNKYGVENVSQIPEVRKKLADLYEKYNLKEKLQTSFFNKYGVKSTMQIPELKEKIISKGVQTRKEKGYIKYVYNNKTLPELIELGEIPFTYSHIRNLIVDNPDLDIFNIKKAYTDLEQKIADFLTTNGIKFKHDLSLPEVGNKRPDFILEDQKIIIECHGLYWHSELLGWSYNKAKKRREDFNSAGYRVISLYQDNIETKWEICKSILTNCLKLNSNKIYARKCLLKLIEDKEEISNFLEQNHLMGKGKGKAIGLYYNNKLISILQFFTRKNKTEISRFCNLLNHSVVGGFSKLLNWLKHNMTSEQITTFIDLDYGVGSYLSRFGFIPNKAYPSFKWTDMNKRFNRFQFPGNTGYEHKLTKIWDSGQQLWFLPLK